MGHYQQVKRGAGLSRLAESSKVPDICTVVECGRPGRAVGMCNTHWKRWKQTGLKGGEIKEFNPGEWGQWCRNAGGYIYRSRIVDGVSQSQMEHRHAVEQDIGRDLLPHETVHHINGVRDDNRIENLELWSISQPKGQRIPDKVAWARELLIQYAPELLAT